MIVTGNELLGIESRPEPWQIRDSNGAVVAGACARHSWIDCMQVTRCEDDLDSLYAALETALQSSDAVILTVVCRREITIMSLQQSLAAAVRQFFIDYRSAQHDQFWVRFRKQVSSYSAYLATRSARQWV